ncbi:hypothetical protein GF351_03315 [Candidatus Woesearchaeota archaeon]|nr:hypothetical protein [Candidatus Woesearchaeota archaeon]
MNEAEKRIFKQIKQRFDSIQDSRKLTPEQETELLSDTTQLIGFLNVSYEPDLLSFVQDMIEFAESRNLSMLSQRMGLEYVIQKHRVSRKPKPSGGSEVFHEPEPGEEGSQESSEAR